MAWPLIIAAAAVAAAGAVKGHTSGKTAANRYNDTLKQSYNDYLKDLQTQWDQEQQIATGRLAANELAFTEEIKSMQLAMGESETTGQTGEHVHQSGVFAKERSEEFIRADLKRTGQALEAERSAAFQRLLLSEQAGPDKAAGALSGAGNVLGIVGGGLF